MFTILIILAVLAVVWVISTTNGFKRKEIKIDEALSGIEVALTKRYDTLSPSCWTLPRDSWSTSRISSLMSYPCGAA